MINSNSANRIKELISHGKVIMGGEVNDDDKYVAPTILTDVKPDDPIMKEEIFGPVLPVIEFDDFSEVYEIIGSNPNPLATYISLITGGLSGSFWHIPGQEMLQLMIL